MGGAGRNLLATNRRLNVPVFVFSYLTILAAVRPHKPCAVREDENGRTDSARTRGRLAP